MKLSLRSSFTFLSLVALLAAPAVSVLAQEGSSVLDAQQVQDQHALEGVEHDVASINDRSAQLEQTLATARAQQASVAKEAARLKQEASVLLPQIVAKSREVQRIEDQLSRTIALDYKSGKVGTLSVLIEDGDVSNALDRVAYIRQIERHMQKLSDQAQRSQDDLAEKKSDLDNKRATQELAERQLVALQATIGQQQEEQRELLNNKNNEAAYLQERIKRAEEMKAELLKGGTASFGTFTNGAAVKQGDVIGFEGSTGFSTGCHTHFSVIDGNRWANPGAYFGMLKQPAGRTSQGFGMTDWAKTGAYGGDIHNGIDYVQGCGNPVRAAADGTVIRDNRTDGSGFGHYVMIRHTNGLVTLYGHLI